MKILIALVALAAAPAHAQGATAQPFPNEPPQILTHDQRAAPNQQRGQRAMRMRALAAVSPEGRDILRGAVSPERAQERAAVRAARDRVNAAIAAERLDVAALRRAMDDENRLVDAMRDRRRAALLEAVQKLSLADRQAFAANAQRGRERLGRQMRYARYGTPAQAQPAQPAPR